MYTVKILNDKDFDTLPYKHAKRSLGLANAKTGVAFVRDTGYNDVTKATISHELDELVNKVSPHEEDGIRYKSLASYGAGAGAGALSNVLGGFLGNKGGMLGKVGNFIGAASPVISAGAGALANRKGQPFRGALQGFAGGGAGSGLVSGASDVIGGLRKPAGTFGQAFENFGGGFKRGGYTDYLGGLPGMKGVGTDDPKGALAQFISGGEAAKSTLPQLNTSPEMQNAILKGQLNAGGIPAGATASGSAAAAPSVLKGDTTKGDGTEGFFKNMIDQLGKGLGAAAPGLALGAFGDAAGPTPTMPNYTGVREDVEGRLSEVGRGENSADVQAAIKAFLNPNLASLGEEAFALGDIENEEAKNLAVDNLVKGWKGAQGGVDVTNNPAFQREKARIEELYDAKRVAQRDAQSLEIQKQNLVNKYNTMSQLLVKDQNQMNQIIQLAQLDVLQLSTEHGVSVQEAQQFKSLFGDLGQVVTGGIMDSFNKQTA